MTELKKRSAAEAGLEGGEPSAKKAMTASPDTGETAFVERTGTFRPFYQVVLQFPNYVREVRGPKSDVTVVVCRYSNERNAKRDVIKRLREDLDQHVGDFLSHWDDDDEDTHECSDDDDDRDVFDDPCADYDPVTDFGTALKRHRYNDAYEWLHDGLRKLKNRDNVSWNEIQLFFGTKVVKLLEGIKRDVFERRLVRPCWPSFGLMWIESHGVYYEPVE